MEILKTIYKYVYTLEEWIRHIDIGGLFENTLIDTKDSDGYMQLLSTSVVACSHDSRQMLHPLTMSQTSHQREVILRVIERIRRKDGTEKNVLTFGFGAMSDDPNAQISSLPNIEYRYPNSSVNRLHYGVWKKLHSRVGDAVMEHLLELTSVFLFIPPSCYVQLTGQPVFNILGIAGQQMTVQKASNVRGGSSGVLQKMKRKVDRKKSKLIEKRAKNELNKKKQTVGSQCAKTSSTENDVNSVDLDRSNQVIGFCREEFAEEPDVAKVTRESEKGNDEKKAKKRKMCDESMKEEDNLPAQKKRKLTECVSMVTGTDNDSRCQGQILTDGLSVVEHSAKTGSRSDQELPLTDSMPISPITKVHSLNSLQHPEKVVPDNIIASGCLEKSSDDFGSQGLTYKENITETGCLQENSGNFPSQGYVLTDSLKPINGGNDSLQCQGHISTDLDFSSTTDHLNSDPSHSQLQGQSLIDNLSMSDKPVHRCLDRYTYQRDQGANDFEGLKDAESEYPEKGQGHPKCQGDSHSYKRKNEELETGANGKVKIQCIRQNVGEIKEEDCNLVTSELSLSSDVRRKKKTRRGRRKKRTDPNKDQILKFEPYRYHTYFCRSNFMYARRLREQISKKFPLTLVDDSEEAVDKLVNIIFIEQSVTDSSLKFKLKEDNSCHDELITVEESSQRGENDEPCHANTNRKPSEVEVQQRTGNRIHSCCRSKVAEEFKVMNKVKDSDGIQNKCAVVKHTGKSQDIIHNGCERKVKDAEKNMEVISKEKFKDIQSKLTTNHASFFGSNPSAELLLLPEKSAGGENSVTGHSKEGSAAKESNSDLNSVVSNNVTENNNSTVNKSETSNTVGFGEKTDELMMKMSSYHMLEDKKISQAEKADETKDVESSDQLKSQSYSTPGSENMQRSSSLNHESITNVRLDGEVSTQTKNSSSGKGTIDTEVTTEQSEHGNTLSDDSTLTKSSLNLSQILEKSASSESNYSIQEVVSATSSDSRSGHRSSMEILVSDTGSELSGKTDIESKTACNKELLISSTPLDSAETVCKDHKRKSVTNGNLELNDISHIKHLSSSKEQRKIIASNPDQQNSFSLAHLKVKASRLDGDVCSQNSVQTSQVEPIGKSGLQVLEENLSQDVSTSQNVKEDEDGIKKYSEKPQNVDHGSENDSPKIQNSTDELTGKSFMLHNEREGDSTDRKGETTVNLCYKKSDEVDDSDDESDIASQNITTVEIPKFQEIRGILKQMINGHRKCRYKVWLKHYCPITSSKRTAQNNGCMSHMTDRKSETQKKPKLKTAVLRRGESATSSAVAMFIQKKRRKTRKTNTQQLLSDFVPHRKIYLFLRTVTKLTIPEELFGSAVNRNLFFKNIRRLISMGRFDKYCLGQLMSGMKTKHMKWLKHTQDHHMKLHLVAKVMYWLMNSYIMELLKSFFYITESTVFRNRLFYYRKVVWSRLHFQALSELRKRGMLQSISKKEVDEALIRGQSLGLASLRFLPKAKSLRPVVNMGRQPPPLCKHTIPVNKQLLNFLQVLSYLKLQHLQWVGASKFGIDDIYTAWKPFVQQWKSSENRQPLYFVKTDIKNCFDDINQEKLYSIIQDFLKQSGEEEFVVRRFSSIVVSAGKLKRQFHRKVCGLDQYTPDFVKYIRGQVEDENLRNIILIDQVINQHEYVEDLLQQLRSLLFHNIVQTGKQYFHQRHGISQGSVLSTLLCNIYYGQMESKLISVQQNELMMRIVDDTLFVSPDRGRAVEFLDMMLKGDPDFNFSTNIQKTLINFDHVDKEHGRIQRCEGDWFSWCGLLFNCQTLDVSNDFSRYEGIAVKDTMTIDLASSAGRTMKNKLLASLRPKCHAILLDLQYGYMYMYLLVDELPRTRSLHQDPGLFRYINTRVTTSTRPSINSSAVVITNCYKLFLLTAFKFHCYACHLPHKQRVEDNPVYFLEMILDVASFFHTQVTVQTKQKFNGDVVFTLSRKAIEWLSIKAFMSKLRKHHSCYSLLLKQLSQCEKKLKKTLKRKDRTLFPALEKLCGKSFPVEFQELL